MCLRTSIYIFLTGKLWGLQDHQGVVNQPFYALGLELLDEGRIERPAHTGFMFQDFQLFPHMTAVGKYSIRSFT